MVPFEAFCSFCMKEATGDDTHFPYLFITMIIPYKSSTLIQLRNTDVLMLEYFASSKMTKTHHRILADNEPPIHHPEHPRTIKTQPPLTLS